MKSSLIPLHSQGMQLKPVVFLDRDGVLCEYREYLHKKEDFKVVATAPEAVARLNRAGFLTLVLTNQPMLARGMMTLATLEEIHEDLKQQVRAGGGELSEIFYCPHDPGPAKQGWILEWVRSCDCRKPGLGMFNQAMSWLRNQGIEPDLARSWMVGDSWRDLVLGQRAGLRCAGVKGIPSLSSPELFSSPDIVASSLLEVVEEILEV